MRSANQYNTIVSSLYPAAVRSRVLEAAPRAEMSNSRAMELKDCRHSNHSKSSRDTIAARSDPIADHFSHTTVLFADIVGFTAWSSGREPVHVFQLLATMYNEFDRIARQLGVFKVETIGDCYVAVTGLTQPQKDHAVIMAKFAKECICAMDELTTSLEPLWDQELPAYRSE